MKGKLWWTSNSELSFPGLSICALSDGDCHYEASTMGVVYILHMGGDYYKIGYSSHFKDRLATFMIGNPFIKGVDSVVALLLPLSGAGSRAMAKRTAQRTESTIHERLRTLNKSYDGSSREIFKLTPLDLRKLFCWLGQRNNVLEYNLRLEFLSRSAIKKICKTGSNIWKYSRRDPYIPERGPKSRMSPRRRTVLERHQKKEAQTEAQARVQRQLAEEKVRAEEQAVIDGYKGVFYSNPGKYKSSPRWKAIVNNDDSDENNRHYLGRYDTAHDAARAYDKKCKELYGEDATLNFPEKVLDNLKYI